MYMFDIIFNFIKIYPDYDPQKELVQDTTSYLFINGKIILPKTLLKRVNILIFHHLFVHLPPREIEEVKVAILYIIMERCRRFSKDWDAVGGRAFFNKLISDSDPQISFLASRFLIDKLQKEQPEQFKQIVNTLLDRAVETNDEQIVSNPYLQIKAILEMKM